MITTLLNIENVATMVCRVPGKEELGGASVGLESWDMDETVLPPKETWGTVVIGLPEFQLELER